MKHFILRIRSNIEKSIQKEMAALLIIAFLVAGTLFTVIYLSLHQLHLLRQAHVNYDNGRMEAYHDLQAYYDRLEEASEEEFENLLIRIHDYLEGEAYVVLEDGTVCSNGTAVYQLDIKAWRNNIASFDDKDKFFAYHPLYRQGNVYYILQNKDLKKSYSYSDEWMLLVAGVVAVTAYFVIVFLSINTKIAYIKKIGEGVEEIKHGNLNTEIALLGKDELYRIAENMNAMQHNLSSLIEHEKEEAKKKYELITGMAHDIKTPITIILGYLGILTQDNSKSEEERKTYTIKAYEKAEALRKMIQTLFHAVKSGSQETEENRSNLSLDRMVRQAISEYEPLASERNLSMVSHISDLPTLYLDSQQMLTVIDNVLSNAIKYCTQSGQIIIDLHQEGNDVVFQVSNSSEPISNKDLSLIFDEFYRMDKSRNSAMEGNGLGLYLVKTTIQKMNGSVWADYKDGMFSIHIRLH